jgi:hypothetical protein
MHGPQDGVGFLSARQREFMPLKVVLEIDWAEQIQSLYVYTSNKKWKTSFKSGVEDGCQTNTKTGKVSIQINSNHPLEKQFYYYLHECGHAIELEKLGKGAWNLKYHGQAACEDVSLQHRISRLYEEMTAWEHAHSIAVDLSLQIDHNNFQTIKTEALALYVAWTYDTIPG